MGQGKVTRDVKLKLYPAIIVLLGLGIVLLLIGRLDITVWTEIEPEESIPSAAAGQGMTSIPSPRMTPVPSPTLDVPSSTAPPPPLDADIALQVGKLRVSNQTPHPVRVALLPQQSAAPTAPDSAIPEAAIAYDEAVHWDFAPEEGSVDGLILSLPDSQLMLSRDDVLVAFAQDGSRRYWGPYVVGKTLQPAWNPDRVEWQLILQP